MPNRAPKWKKKFNYFKINVLYEFRPQEQTARNSPAHPVSQGSRKIFLAQGASGTRKCALHLQNPNQVIFTHTACLLAIFYACRFAQG